MLQQKDVDILSKQRTQEEFFTDLEERYLKQSHKTLFRYGEYLKKEMQSQYDKYFYGYKKFVTPRYFSFKPKTGINLLTKQRIKTRLKFLQKTPKPDSYKNNLLNLNNQTSTKQPENTINLLKNEYLFYQNISDIEKKYRDDYFPTKTQKTSSGEHPNKDDTNEKIDNKLSCNKPLKEQKSVQNRNKPRLFNIKVLVRMKSEQTEYNFKNINLRNRVSELKQAIIEELTNNFNEKISNALIKSLTFILNHQVMVDDNLLLKYQSDLMRKPIICVAYDNLKDDYEKEKKSLEILNKALEAENNIAPDELVPVLTKPGYKTSPDYCLLWRMTIGELMAVKNFKIHNQFGEVEFLEDVNLVGLNLDEIFTINFANIDIKDENIKAIQVKKRCTFKDIFPPPGKSKEEEFQKAFESAIESKGGKFVEYDKQSGNLIFEC